MSIIYEKIRKVLRHPLGSLIIIAGYDKASFIPDELYLRIMYRYYNNRKLNLKHPQYFNEKLQWLKLYDRNPRYKDLVDKVKVREYIKKTIGDEYLIPCLGVWKTPEDIDFEKLPNQFVLKCNHNSGLGMCICKDKAKIDVRKVKEGLHRGLKENKYYIGREWPYKDVERMIIGEKYMVDESGEELKDYKVLCFNGEPRLIELHRGRFTDHQTQDFYDTIWNKTSISQSGMSQFQVTKDLFPKPTSLDEMLRLSRILAKGLPHVRVDWYSINGKLYFGEITLFDGSGLYPWDNPEDDLLLGSWIKLPID